MAAVAWLCKVRLANTHKFMHAWNIKAHLENVCVEKQYFGCSTGSKNDVTISKWVNELVTSKGSTGTIISRIFTIPGGDKCPYTKGRSISKAGRGRAWPGRLKTPSQFKKMHVGGGGEGCLAS